MLFHMILNLNFDNQISYSLLELLLVLHVQRCSFCIQWVCGVRIEKQLRQEYVENVDKIKHRRPGLIDNIEADRP